MHSTDFYVRNVASFLDNKVEDMRNVAILLMQLLENYDWKNLFLQVHNSDTAENVDATRCEVTNASLKVDFHKLLLRLHNSGEETQVVVVKMLQTFSNILNAVSCV